MAGFLDVVGGTRLAAPRDMAQGDQLRARVKLFAADVLNFIRTLPQDPATIAVVRQLAKSAPSISANYHSAGRSRSRAEFKSRLSVVVDEADETVGWLELLKETCPVTGPQLDRLLGESRELREPVDVRTSFLTS